MNDNTAAVTAEDPNLLRHFSRELAVALNDHELQSYGKMLAEKVREEELAEEKKKQVTAEHSNRIKAIRVEIKRIADARAKGEELRPVKCAERLRGNVIEIVRLDRMEVVDTRPADLRDLQTSIPGTGVPEMPESFDEGPRGDAMGSMVTSSTGGAVYSGAPGDGESLCGECSEGITEDDETAERNGLTVHLDCAEEIDERAAMEAGGGEPPALTVVRDERVEPDDALIDQKLTEREQAQKDEADYGGAKTRKTAAEKAAAEAKRLEEAHAREADLRARAQGKKRERSKSKNDAKKKR